MSNKWLRTVNEINRERYKIPAGWETKERIAEQLQCAPEKVKDLLKAGVEMGRFEKDDFPIWDDGRRMTVRVTCYRVIDADAAKKPAKALKTTGNKTLDKVRKCLAKHPDWDDIRIAKSCGCRVQLVRDAR